MKLEEGMYVKTKKYGIAKVIGNVDDNKFNIDIFKKDGITLRCQKMKDIIKASYNIIDLIEAGDIIEVNEFKGNYEVKQFGLELSIIKDEYIYNLNSLHCKLNIKSIVTKQQFESMKYEVKEDE